MMSGSNIVVGMKKKEKSKDSLDESLDSLESGDRSDDSLEILDDSLGMSQLTIGHRKASQTYSECKSNTTMTRPLEMGKVTVSP